jgi:hypothetical protein
LPKVRRGKFSRRGQSGGWRRRIGEKSSPDDQWIFLLSAFLYTVPDADMLGDFGLEARARGLIDFLDADFMCFVGRDKETGKLVKNHHRENEKGEFVEEREFVD